MKKNKVSGYIYFNDSDKKHDIFFHEYSNERVVFSFVSNDPFVSSSDFGKNAIIGYFINGKEIVFISNSIRKIDQIHFCCKVGDFISKDHRKFKRFSLNNKPTCILIKNFSFFDCTILNYSAGGVSISSNEELKNKVFFLYSYFEDISFVNKKCKIAWSKKASNSLFHYGLEFLE